MEEPPENSKESSHSAHANGINEYKILINQYWTDFFYNADSDTCIIV